MVPGQRDAVVEVRPDARQQLVIDVVGLQVEAPLDALLGLDGADRLAVVRVVEREAGGLELLHRRRHVLIVGQRVELAEAGHPHRPVELARPVVDQHAAVFRSQRVALAAELGGPEEVVEVGPVPARRQLPGPAAVAQPEVELLLVRQLVAR